MASVFLGTLAESEAWLLYARGWDLLSYHANHGESPRADSECTPEQLAADARFLASAASLLGEAFPRRAPGCTHVNARLLLLAVHEKLAATGAHERPAAMWLGYAACAASWLRLLRADAKCPVPARLATRTAFESEMRHELRMAIECIEPSVVPVACQNELIALLESFPFEAGKEREGFARIVDAWRTRVGTPTPRGMSIMTGVFLVFAIGLHAYLRIRGPS